LENFGKAEPYIGAFLNGLRTVKTEVDFVRGGLFDRLHHQYHIPKEVLSLLLKLELHTPLFGEGQ
jgi:hypothetical protein